MTIPRLMQGKLSLPVIGSPLFIVSGPDLVIAQCKAGIVGSFPALNARPKEVLDEWIIRIKEALAAYQKASTYAKELGIQLCRGRVWLEGREEGVGNSITTN